MKKIFFLTLFSILTISVFSQKVSKQLIVEYEDTLKVMAHTIMNGENQAVKTEANNAFISTLQEVLQLLKRGANETVIMQRQRQEAAKFSKGKTT